MTSKPERQFEQTSVVEQALTEAGTQRDATQALKPQRRWGWSTVHLTYDWMDYHIPSSSDSE